jgi:hypothetical protein
MNEDRVSKGPEKVLNEVSELCQVIDNQHYGNRKELEWRFAYTIVALYLLQL